MKGIEIIRKKMNLLGIDGLVIDSPYKILYLLERYESFNLIELSLCMVLTKKSIYITGDPISLYKLKDGDYIKMEADTYNYLCNNYTFIKEVQKIVGREKIKRLGLITRGYESVQRTEIAFVEDIISNMAMIKNSEEIRILEKISGILDKTFKEIKLEKGITELDLKRNIETELLENGADRRAFPCIVAFGNHTQDPHPVPGIRKLKDGDTILIDIGAMLKGYSCDLTRTIISENNEFYEIILEAEKRVLNFIKPGRIAREADRIAREFIKDKGYGKYFLRILGYPVGFLRSGIFLSPSSNEVLKRGMVFAISPAIYIPGQGGVRLTDTVLVTNDGCRLLTKAEK
jgi:Xaa-Pro aminopeptidase